MRFRLIGATDGHVTGSCTHFSYDRKKIQFLVDCGMVQGEGEVNTVNSNDFPFAPQEIKFVLLTHAHLDHCGLIPKLYKDGFKGTVICTSATAKIARASLLDSATHSTLFTKDDVERIRFDCLDEREKFGLSKFMAIADDLFVSFCRTAHILGSVAITLSWINDAGERPCMVLSGDLGNNTKLNPYQPLLAGRQEIYGYPETILVESTYGGRIREQQFSSYEQRLMTLKNIIQDVIFDRKEILIIPAFAIQRTQEILLDIYSVMNKFFSKESENLAPFYASNSLDNDLKNNGWSYLIHRNLEKAIATLPEIEQQQWLDSIIELGESDDTNGINFRFKETALYDINDLKNLLSQKNYSYGIDIVVDSPLALEISNIYSKELSKRQKFTPTETMYRNRLMADRLNLASEEEVDELIHRLFSKKEPGDEKIFVHTHQFKSPEKGRFRIPRLIDIQDRGLILITGGGMCNGGPIIQHLKYILEHKREATILSTGYMPEGSIGHSIFKHGKAKIDGSPQPLEPIQIEEKKYTLDEQDLNFIECNDFYSGHADQSGINDFIFKVKGADNPSLKPVSATVFINHGQHASRNALKESIEQRAALNLENDRQIKGVELTRDYLHWYDLNKGSWVEPVKLDPLSEALAAILSEQRRTNNLLERLLDKDTKNKYAVTKQKKK